MKREPSFEKKVLDELNNVMTHGRIDAKSRQSIGRAISATSENLERKANSIAIVGMVLKKLGPALLTGLTIIAGIITVVR